MVTYRLQRYLEIVLQDEKEQQDYYNTIFIQKNPNNRLILVKWK
jgi:hypothetical protein